jgi:signal transduction histidine kinase
VADDAEPERRRRSFEAIEERVSQLHGEIAVHASDAGGTEVRVTLPPYTARR